MGKLIFALFVLVVGLGAQLTPVLIQQQYSPLDGRLPQYRRRNAVRSSRSPREPETAPPLGSREAAG